MESDDPVSHKVNDYLERQSTELDTRTLQRLDAARHQAVALAERRAERHAGLFKRPWFVNAGYVAAFSLAVTTGILVLNAQPEQDVDSVTPLELVLLNDDFEMMEEELAFYDWMENELGGRG